MNRLINSPIRLGGKLLSLVLLGQAAQAASIVSASVSMNTPAGSLSCPAPGIQSPIGTSVTAQCDLQYGTVGTAGDFGRFIASATVSLPSTIVPASFNGTNYQAKKFFADLSAAMGAQQGPPMTDVLYDASINLQLSLSVAGNFTGNGVLRVGSTYNWALGPVFAVNGVAVTPCEEHVVNCPTFDIPVSLDGPISVTLSYEIGQYLPSAYQIYCGGNPCGSSFGGQLQDASLFFLELRDSNNNAIPIANLAEMPEPAAWLMSACGLLVLMGCGRCGKQTSKQAAR